MSRLTLLMGQKLTTVSITTCLHHGVILQVAVITRRLAMETLGMILQLPIPINHSLGYDPPSYSQNITVPHIALYSHYIAHIQVVYVGMHLVVSQGYPTFPIEIIAVLVVLLTSCCTGLLPTSQAACRGRIQRQKRSSNLPQFVCDPRGDMTGLTFTPQLGVTANEPTSNQWTKTTFTILPQTPSTITSYLHYPSLHLSL